MIYYADTSVLVKRYVLETGSAWTRALMRSAAGNTVLTAQISWIELYSALNRRLREQAISQLRYARLKLLLSYVWPVQYVLVAQTPQLLETARQLVERHPLRAYDAVQLASAVNARQSLFSSPTTITFLFADKQLLAAAQTEGFVTDNPNLH